MLIRQPQNIPKDFDNSRQQQQFQTLLRAEHFNNNVEKALRLVFSANTVAASSTNNAIKVINDGINAIDDLVNVEKDIVNAQDYIKDDKSLQISTNL